MTARRRPIDRAPIVPDRVRSIGGRGFSFIPNRFLQDGFLASLQPDELLLYFFLVLASDRWGLSFYHYDALCSLLRMQVDRYVAARNGLIAKDLLAFDGARFQVLSLPEHPVPVKPLSGPKDFEEEDGATIHALIRRSLDEAQER
jgi:hypothetical protein